MESERRLSWEVARIARVMVRGCFKARSISEAARAASGTEGIDVSPEGGAAFAAAKHLRRNGTLGPESRVVIFNTGAGWLYRA